MYGSIGPAGLVVAVWCFGCGTFAATAEPACAGTAATAAEPGAGSSIDACADPDPDPAAGAGAGVAGAGAGGAGGGAGGAGAADPDPEAGLPEVGLPDLADSPFARSTAPVPASARSIKITTEIRPHGRRTIGIDSPGCESCEIAGDCARGRADAPGGILPCGTGVGGRDGIGWGVGDRPCTADSGVGARDMLGGMLAGPGVYGIPGAATCGGYGASSSTFTVGATRGGSETGMRAPHPPQNRESTSLSVPQDGQRIP